MSKPVALLLLVLLAPLASAEFVVRTYTNDFALSSPTGDLALCACQPVIDAVNVENVGDVTATIALNAQGPSWLSLAQTQVTLAPDEGAAVPLAVSAPCGARQSADFTIIATSDQGRQKVLRKAVRVMPCQTIAASLTGPETLLPCDTGRFELTVKNAGPFKDTFEVASALPEVSLSQRRFDLEPGASATPIAFVAVACDRAGDFAIPFTVRAVQNGQSAEFVHRLSLPTDFGYTVSVSPLRICAGATTTVPVTLKNQAAFENAYALRVQSPAFARAAAEPVSVKAGATHDIPLTLRPAATNVGRHALRLQAESRVGAVRRRLSQTVEVLRCYEAAVDVAAQEGRCCGPLRYLATVENRGFFEDTFEVRVEGPLWVGADRPSVTLAPGESAQVLLTLDAPCVDARSEFSARAVSKAGAEAAASFVVETAQAASCYRLEVSAGVVTLHPGEVRVPVRNAGRESAAYQVALVSDMADLASPTVTLAPGESTDLIVVPKNMSGIRPGRYPATLRFMGPAAFEHQLFLEVRGPHPLVAFGRFLARDPPCLALVILFLLLALLTLYVLNEATLQHWFAGGRVVVFKRRPRGPAFVQRWLLAVGLIYLAGVVLLLLRMPMAAAAPSPSALELYTAKNTPLDVDLSALFYDPDGDLLTFSAGHADDVGIEVLGKTARLTPAKDFLGSRTLAFAASDGRGGTAQSPPLTLQVYEPPVRSFWTLMGRWCAGLFWTLSALAASWLGLALDRRGSLTISRR